MGETRMPPETESRSTHDMVVGLHHRFDTFAKEQHDIRKKVDELDNRMSIVETVTSLHQQANVEARQNMKDITAAVERRLDKLLLGVALTLISVLGGMSVLLYQSLAGAI
jgi:uncharacterized protein YoxC